MPDFLNTKILKINPVSPEINQLEIAADILQKGGLVAFPTETVYGLGANALNEKAVAQIFLAKGRPQDNPLIVHIADKNDLYQLSSNVSDKALLLVDKFWPGPLTLILKKTEIVPDIITAGLDCVAIRMPSHPIALALIKEAKIPLAAPSANLSGKPSPTDAQHVIDDLYHKIDLIIDGGEVEIGIESTVLDLTTDIPQILRPGKITKQDLEEIIGKVTENTSSKETRSPGMKYRHYSPQARVFIVNNEQEIQAFREKYPQQKIQILNYPDEIKMARQMFSDFRKSDQAGYDIILVQSIKAEGLGLAIMNRLKKASLNEKLG
ncbi:MAG TPA: L-threonylcarbamoyladenylate synthase [Candidatus Gracilibacteria bacterium]|nr:L-threonylcarbamoyladenylate synthase [Candidatus Gracilibacteria bacterium]